MVEQFLKDNYAPVAVETTATDLPVIGELPRELAGRYLRNGPNPVADVDPATHHWFLGDGMVHGVRLEDGKAAWYRNRWVRTPEVCAALGEPIGGRNLGGTANTHVIGHAGRTWAIVEAGAAPVELDDELGTVGVNPFFGTLKDGAFTAHPKIDPDSGELHAMAYHWPDFGDHVQYVQVARDGRVVRTENIPVPGMIMMHDMSLTANYVVVYDLPVTVSLDLIARGMRFPFAWNDDYAPRIGLLPRQGTAADMTWYEVRPGYVFHPMNAYEDTQGRVVLDVCRYERMFQQDVQGPFGDSLATLERWTVSPGNARVDQTCIDERPLEFPRCNPGYSSKPYRYGYSLAVAGEGFPAINKHDLQTGQCSRHELAPGRHAAEPFFVPREGAAHEDDGYLLSFVYDAERDASELMVLDANDVTAAPLARVLLPARVPYGFHGAWVPDGYDGPCV